MDPGKGQAGVKSVHSRSSDTCGAGNGLWDRSHEKVGVAGRGRDGSVAPREVFAPLPRDRSP